MRREAKGNRGAEKKGSKRTVPLLVENKNPEVIGVLVVAEGATSATVREKLLQASATLLNISPHQVCVMAGVGSEE